jgi:hypothetical protein
MMHLYSFMLYYICTGHLSPSLHLAPAFAIFATIRHQTLAALTGAMFGVPTSFSKGVNEEKDIHMVVV